MLPVRFCRKKMASSQPVSGKEVAGALRPLATEEAEAAKDWPELCLDAASWIERGQVWVLELEPYHDKTSPESGGNLEEIQQSASIDRADSENLAKEVAVSESQHQSDEGMTIPFACQQSKKTSADDGETLGQNAKLAINWNNHAKNLHVSDQCEKSFYWPSELAQHHKNVHGESKGTRWDQNKLEAFKPSLHHQKSITITDESHCLKHPRICNQCGKEFRWPSDLARHQQRVHSRKNRVRQNLCQLEGYCPSPAESSPLQAEKTFAASYHSLNEDSDSTTFTKHLHICDQCGKNFRWPSDLARHQQRVHSRKNKARQNLCQLEGYCPSSMVSSPLQAEKTFAASYQTLNEDSDNTTFTKHLHICNQCGKNFRWPSDLARHQQRGHSRRNKARQKLCQLEACCPSPMVSSPLQAEHIFANSCQSLIEDSDSTNCTKNLHTYGQCGKAFQCPSALHQYKYLNGKAVRQNQSQSETCSLGSLTPSFPPLEVENTLIDSHEALTQMSVLMADQNTHFRKPCICSQYGKTFQILSNVAQQKCSDNMDMLMKTKCTQVKKPYVCDQCGKQFKWSSHLDRHKHTHLRSKLRASHLRDRLKRSNHTAVMKSYVCDHCGKKFRWPSGLARHKRTHTRKKQPKHYFCEQCGQSFKCASDFIQHASTHSSDRPYSCAICGFRFRRHAPLKRHLIWHEENHEMGGEDEDQEHQDAHSQDLSADSIPSDQPYHLDLQSSQEYEKSFVSLKSCECRECHTIANDNHGLLPSNSIWEIGTNGVSHILPLVQTCECGYCGIDDGNLDMNPPDLLHLKTSITASDEFPSALPTKSTVLNISSEDHKSIAYMERNEASTASTPTLAQCSHAMAGQSHKRSSSPSNPASLLEQTSPSACEKKPFACPKCSKQFSLLSYLTRHLLIHQPGKPYHCTTCKKSFARRSYLLKHQKLHTVNLACECQECGRCFTQMSYLRKHMQIHTNQTL